MKFYESEAELLMRFGIWLSNHAMIEGVNAAKLNFTFGHNQFSDLTEKELLDQISCLGADNLPEYPIEDAEEGYQAPSSYDWSQHGAVAPV